MTSVVGAEMEKLLRSVDQPAGELEEALANVAAAKATVDFANVKLSDSGPATSEEEEQDSLMNAMILASDAATALDSRVSEIAVQLGTGEDEVRQRFKNYVYYKDEARYADKVEKATFVDLVFVLDATGSMDNMFLSVKEKIREIIGDMQESFQGKFRLGLVAYRDVGDGEKRFVEHQLSGSISGLEKQLESIKCSGGGDICEDVIGGLAKASKFDFKAHVGGGVSMILLCGDAPCHGKRYYVSIRE